MQLLFQGKSKALHFLPGLSYESNTGALYSPVRGLMGSRNYCLVGLEWHFACKDRACLLCSQKSERIFKGSWIEWLPPVFLLHWRVFRISLPILITSPEWGLALVPFSWSPVLDPCLCPALCNASV